MDNTSIGLVTEARVRVKTRLAVCHAKLEQQNLFRTNGQFLGPIEKR